MIFNNVKKLHPYVSILIHLQHSYKFIVIYNCSEPDMNKIKAVFYNLTRLVTSFILY